MITLKKLFRKSITPLLLKRPTPIPYFHIFFLSYRILPPLREANEIHPLPLKKGGGSELCSCVARRHKSFQLEMKCIPSQHCNISYLLNIKFPFIMAEFIEF